MIKVSIIVPVYNTSKYLEKCLDSLVNQTLNDIEIIIINDCSTDKSLDIIEKYRKKQKNIKLINNKVNKGIGYNRNLGIKESKGDYILFVDSDDYIDNNYSEELYNYVVNNNLDIAVCDVKKIDDNGKLISYENDIKDFDTSNLKDNPKLLLDINMGPANKIFSSKLFSDKSARFDEKLKYEDIALIPRLIMNSKKVGKINNVYYNYVIHDNSETTTMNERVFDILKIMDKVNKYLFKYKYYDLIKDEVEYLSIRTLLRYTLQQKNQKDKRIANKFINEVFSYLDSTFPKWKNNKYLKQRNVLKRLIETNKLLTKMYCDFKKKLV